LFRISVHGWAESLAAGKLSDKEIEYLKSLPRDKHGIPLSRLILSIAYAIRLGGDAATPDDVPAHLSAKGKLSHYRSMSEIADFLKHADRDPKAVLSLKDVSNLELIRYASLSYGLVSNRLTPEMTVFQIFLCSTPELRFGLTPDLREIAESLDRLTPSKRRAACAKFIRISKKDGIAAIRPN
jgi:hypothetical protein